MIPLSMNRNRTGNLLMLLLALYLASPADIIPDFIPAAGWIDDIFVILWAVFKIMDRTNKKKRFRTWLPGRTVYSRGNPDNIAFSHHRSSNRIAVQIRQFK